MRNNKTKLKRIGVAIGSVIFILIIICFSFYSFQTPDKSSMSCSSDNKQCLYVASDNGGATTSFYNRVYLYNDNFLFKKLLFAVDKVFPSQIQLIWNSTRDILVVVPDCLLVERIRNIDNLNISFQEDNGTNLVDCKFQK